MKSIRVVAAIIKDKDKILATKRSYGEFKGGWEFPGGKIEEGEDKKTALIREIKEETGCDVKLDGVCYVANRILEDDLLVMIVFNAKLINENIEFDKEEILDVKWFDYDEIVNKMESMLRGNYVRTAVINQNNNLVAPIDIVDILKD